MGGSEASESLRRGLVCAYRPPCPGCPRFDERELSPSALAALRSLKLHPDAEPLTELTCDGPGFRHRVRLSVRSFGGHPRLGLFELGSHRLVPIEGCLLHHPSLKAVLECLKASLARGEVKAYDEERHQGLLRAVELAASRTTSVVQVVLVVNDPLDAPEPVKQTFRGVLADLEQLGVVSSVFFNAQPNRTNTLLGARFVRVFGPEALEQDLLGTKNFFPPGAFGQANPALHECAVERIIEWVPSGARVVEYHAGVGSIGLAVHGARPLASLKMNEISGPSLAGLRLGLRALSEPQDIEVIEGPAGQNTELLRNADVVIVDPPRKGLEEDLLRALIAHFPGRLIYLSCGLPAFLKEASALAKAGILPRFLGAYSYFPFTEHVETLAVFERSP